MLIDARFVQKTDKSRMRLLLMLIAAACFLLSCTAKKDVDIVFGQNITWGLTIENVIDVLGSDAVHESEGDAEIGKFDYILATGKRAYGHKAEGILLRFYETQLYSVAIQYDDLRDVDALIDVISSVFGKPDMAGENAVGDAFASTRLKCAWTDGDTTHITLSWKDGDGYIVAIQNKGIMHALEARINETYEVGDDGVVRRKASTPY